LCTHPLRRGFGHEFRVPERQYGIASYAHSGAKQRV
jgi:hypothetical protein